MWLVYQLTHLWLHRAGCLWLVTSWPTYVSFHTNIETSQWIAMEINWLDFTWIKHSSWMGYCPNLFNKNLVMPLLHTDNGVSFRQLICNVSLQNKFEMSNLRLWMSLHCAKLRIWSHLLKILNGKLHFLCSVI